MLAISLLLSGCELLKEILPSEDGRDTEVIDFTLYDGEQTDIEYQRFDVFNDIDAFNLYLARYQAINALSPSFDATTQTLVSVISYAEPCFFTPKVSNVIKERRTDSGVTFLVHVKNVAVINGDSDKCRANPLPRYIINIAVFEKTDKPVSLHLRNDNYVH